MGDVGAKTTLHDYTNRILNRHAETTEIGYPGAFHHVMGRGIDGIEIFRKVESREDFLNRLAKSCESEALYVYALCVGTDDQPLFMLSFT